MDPFDVPFQGSFKDCGIYCKAIYLWEIYILINIELMKLQPLKD